MDCSKSHHECKAVCCGAVPLPEDLVNRHNFVRPVKELVKGEGIVIPITEDGYCPFLSSDLKCTVYDERPYICKEFGKEYQVFLICPWQSWEGRIRTKHERSHLIRKIGKKAKYLINKYKLKG